MRVRGYVYIAWLIALAGCLVSLYYGEIQQIEPCRLCWYQRMALFPLGWILGASLYRNTISFLFLAWPFIALGAFSALYQSVGIRYPSLSLCGQQCSESLVRFTHHFSFAELSFAGFFAIAFFLYAAQIKR